LSARSGISDVYLFGYCQRIINLDTEIPDGAFDLGMAEQELDGAQVDSYDVAAAKLAIDGEVEQGEVTYSSL
jgi:hypothetical protein